MTLHENLERKRRQNIVELSKSGACHLCQCTSGSRSYSRFIGEGDGRENGLWGVTNRSTSVADPPQEVPMRTCMCYGNTTDWPYSLKVCEMCVADDLTTGRVRSCGICGVVACDENCGVELVEVTDKDEWNNAGCLECRGMESFSEMELFRRRPHPNGMPRVTRVCTSCLELFSLFSFGTKYDFTCRYFKCTNLLVPSHVVELKRFLKPFPLSLLPEELLDSIVDFLGGKDLFSFGMVCTSIFRKVEHSCMGIVTRFNHELPTGPTQIVLDKRNNKKMVYAVGKNSHLLRPPEDGKTWVGVLNQMEQLTRDIYYFNFQIKSGDDGAAMRYLRSRDKVAFDCAYSKPSGTGVITPYLDSAGLSVRGGQVLVTRYKWHHSSLTEEREERNNVRSIIFSTDKILGLGIHRVIIRYYCFCEGESLGSIGILRQSEKGRTVTWAQSCNIVCQGRMEEHVFGLEFDANRSMLMMYKKNYKTNKIESAPGANRAQTIPDEGGNLVFAAALSTGSFGIKGNQLSIRACNKDEWLAFLSHAPQRNMITRIRGRGRRGEERLMRYLDQRARRAFAGQNGDARVEVEHMMEMLIEDDIEHDPDSDSDLFEDDMHVEGAAPNLARHNLIPRAAGIP